MSPRRSPSDRSQSGAPGRPRRPSRLKPDLTSADPLTVLKALAHEAWIAAQIDKIPQAALAQALATIDDFNEMARLPPIYPHLVGEMQLEIDRQRIA